MAQQSDDGIVRFVHGDSERPAMAPMPIMDDWLDDLMGEREALILRLRQIDRVLVKYGRLKSQTLPTRVR